MHMNCISSCNSPRQQGQRCLGPDTRQEPGLAGGKRGQGIEFGEGRWRRTGVDRHAAEPSQPEVSRGGTTSGRAAIEDQSRHMKQADPQDQDRADVSPGDAGT